MKLMKNMRTLVFVFLMTVLVIVVTDCTKNVNRESAGQLLITDTYEQGSYKLEISYPSGSLEYGSTARIVLRIEYPEEEKYILLPPEINDTGRFSNTGIISIEEGRPVPDGNGKAVSTVVFMVEAWLPGTLVFPPLTVSFPGELTTDEFEISVDSAFDEEAGHELSSIYLPEAEDSPIGKIIIIIAVSAVFSATAAVLLFKHKRKEMRNRAVPEKSRAELIEEFRKCYIDTDARIDLRKAYAELERLIGESKASRYGKYIEKARFSGEGIDYTEGYRILMQIFGQELAEAGDAV